MYIYGFLSKPGIPFFYETDYIAALDRYITIPHNVSKPYTNRQIRNLLKTHFFMITHIKMRRIIHPFFVSPKHSTKFEFRTFDAKQSIYIYSLLTNI